ncbi:hypothetical protein [Telluribacter humicola]
MILNLYSCQDKNPEPNFPPTKAYYAFRVFKPTNPSQPRNEVGFDTLSYRAEDGSTHILTNRTIYYTNDYDTTIYTNVHSDRILEGYLVAGKAQNVTIEVGIIDKSGAKRKQDYKLVGSSNQASAAASVVRVRLRKEVPLDEIRSAN